MRQFLDRNFRTNLGIVTLSLAAGLFALAPALHAQSNASQTASTVQTPPPATANSAVVPARPRIRVERLSLVEGTVHVLRGDNTQFPQAAMNMPLTQGMKVETGNDGRAEIEFEDGSVARITPNSSITLVSLQAPLPTALETTTVEQNSGLIYYELRSDPRAQFHVNFNGRTATPVVNSTFRIDLNNSPKDLGVLDGKVRIDGPSDNYSAEVPQGKTIQFAASGNEPYTIANWLAPNGFDDWNQQLDQEAAQQAKNQTPARVQQGGGSIMDTGYGWSDLDSYGGWYPLPGYGMVWQPYGAGAGFNPYGYGSWAFYGGGLGYTWVSGYPWGWLPFNCGAWNYIGSFGWGWTPGAYGCGGFGIGFGYGYGYGGYSYVGGGHHWRHGHHPHCNIDHAPAGYRAPVPPRIAKGQMPQRLVHVGTRPRGMAMRMARLDSGGRLSSHFERAVKFNGDKISPLQAMNRSVSFHNAALFNNRSAHAFSGHGMELSGNRMRTDGGREGLGGGRPASMERSMNRSLEGGHDRNFHAVRDASRSERAFGGRDQAAFDRRAAFGRQSAFGQRATFGAHSTFGSRRSFGPGGSFGGRRSAFAGASFHNGFRSAGGFRGAGGMGRSAGFAGRGFHGGAARSGGFQGGGGSHSSSGGGGGFHGGGGGGGFHGGGGGFSGGGGGHAGGGGGHTR